MSTYFRTQIIHYLGTPYTHPDPAVQQFRHQAVTLLAYQFFLQGKLAYSPITHNVPIDQCGFSGDWLVWREFDQNMLARCGKLVVFQLPGWQDSKGLQNEINFAQAHNIPIEYLEPTAELLEQAARTVERESAIAQS